MVEFYRDFDWELDRFVEYRLPIKKPLLVFRIGTEIVFDWPVRIGQSSNSRVNRTDSAHSINTRSASNMIPCFPANNSTDMHHHDIVSSRSSPSHFTNDTPLNISKVRTRSTTKKLNHCLENQIGYNLRNRNMGKCSCCNSSQDD